MTLKHVSQNFLNCSVYKYHPNGHVQRLFPNRLHHTFNKAYPEIGLIVLFTIDRRPDCITYITCTGPGSEVARARPGEPALANVKASKSELATVKASESELAHFSHAQCNPWTPLRPVEWPEPRPGLEMTK